MPVDMFPAMNIPVVVVATFYSGMPPEQIETDITSRFERFFTLGSGIEHIESRSLPGVSVIKVYFQPGTNPDSAVTTISNLAMAQLRRLPPGTLPPVVLKFDASSLPVCLVTFKGEGLNETAAPRPRSVPGAQPDRQRARRQRAAALRRHATGRSWCTPIPYKLEAHQLSLMDVVRAVNNANLILPAGDVQIGPLDYNIYTNSQLRTIARDQRASREDGGPVAGARRRHRRMPKTRSRFRPTSCAWMASDRSTLPVLKQGGDTNTIAVVDGVRDALDSSCSTCPKQLVTKVVFDQSRVREDRHRDAAARRRASGCCSRR